MAWAPAASATRRAPEAGRVAGSGLVADPGRREQHVDRDEHVGEHAQRRHPTEGGRRNHQRLRAAMPPRPRRRPRPAAPRLPSAGSGARSPSWSGLEGWRSAYCSTSPPRSAGSAAIAATRPSSSARRRPTSLVGISCRTPSGPTPTSTYHEVTPSSASVLAYIRKGPKGKCTSSPQALPATRAPNSTAVASSRVRRPRRLIGIVTTSSSPSSSALTVTAHRPIVAAPGASVIGDGDRCR